MTTYDIISDLCKQRGIAITALEKELGFEGGILVNLRPEAQVRQ